MTPWWQGVMVGYDCESTGVDPEHARIVQAALARVDARQDPPTVKDATWLVNPGVPIPLEATAVHAITDEMVQRDGRPAAEAVAELTDGLEEVALAGGVVVIFNAPYDLTVLDRECRRHGVTPLAERDVTVPVIDPLLIDRWWLDRFRSGSRKLAAVSAHYGARTKGAHTAVSDALQSVRLAYVMGKRADVVRMIRRKHAAEDEYELGVMREQWAAIKDDAGLLHAAQVQWARERALDLRDYFASEGNLERAREVEREADGWPWRQWEPVCSEHGREKPCGVCEELERANDEAMGRVAGG